MRKLQDNAVGACVVAALGTRGREKNYRVPFPFMERSCSFFFFMIDIRLLPSADDV
jgi:hypothetical protein